MFAQTTTHATLLQRVAAGVDATAWREFCDRYGELIQGFARRRGLQAADCDDVMQDVLIALTKAMPGFTYDPGKGKFRSYLKTVVMRSIAKKNLQRSGEVALEHIEEATRAASTDADAEAAWEVEWRQYHLRQAMKTVETEFNATDRAAFQAYGIDGQAAEAVSERFGVYQAKSRIMRRLSTVIEQQIVDEG
jgi:RNA polymerase sigma-70 factor (ECF subfamily)